MNQATPIPRVSSASYPSAGATTNFQFFYKASLGADGLDIAAGLKRECERSLSLLKSWFLTNPPNLPFKVNVTDDPAVAGAMHYGCAETEIYVGVIEKTSPASAVYSLLLAAEVAEVFEAAIGRGWNCGYSNGEALSRVLPAEIFPGAQTPDLMTVPDWLYKKDPGGRLRQNWIDQTDANDSNSFSVGCSVLFLNWLHFSLDYSWNRIVSAGAETLAGVYQNLTGRSDGWQRFKVLVDNQFNSSKPHVTNDNPFKLRLAAMLKAKIRNIFSG
jgi:hypothetical protein